MSFEVHETDRRHQQRIDELLQQIERDKKRHGKIVNQHRFEKTVLMVKFPFCNKLYKLFYQTN